MTKKSQDKKSRVQLHVGVSRQAIKDRFLAAAKRAEKGDLSLERHVTFANWDMLAKALSAKRLELIRYVRQHPVRRVTDLARALGRDYRNVHEDVAILEAAGLLQKTEAGLRVEYSAIQSEIRL